MYERKLGWLEGSFLGTNLVNVAIADVNAILDPAELEKASMLTQTYHPNLRINVSKPQCVPITSDSGENKYARTREIKGKVPFSSFTVEDSKEFNEFISKAQNFEFDFDCDSPLWKVDVAFLSQEKRTKLCITFLHTIGDGTSGAIIINGILQIYQHITTSSDYPARPQLPFLPDAEFLSFPGGVSSKEQSRAEELARALAMDRASWHPAIPYEPSCNARSNRALLSETAAPLARRIFERCRAEGVTVGALLLASLHFAVAKLAHTAAAAAGATLPLPWRFQHDVDANLRDRVHPPLGSDHVGLLIGMLPVALQFDTLDTCLWDAARRAAAILRAAVAAREPHLYHIANRLLEDPSFPLPLHGARTPAAAAAGPADAGGQIDPGKAPSASGLAAAVSAAAAGDRCVDLNFSNVGKYPFETKFPQAGFELERLHTVGYWCPAVGTHVFLIHTVGDTLCYSWVHEGGAANARAAAALFDDTRAAMEAAPLAAGAGPTLADFFAL